MADKEIEALSKISSALDGLDEDVIRRVLTWATSKYGIVTQKVPVSKQVLSNGAESQGNGEYSDFTDLYAEAHPKTDNDKVLVAAYWVQEVGGAKEWDSQTLNDLLKNLGHPISNITKTLGRLQDQKPGLAMQTQKTGKSRQGRKRYKMTVEGIKQVKQMLLMTPNE